MFYGAIDTYLPANGTPCSSMGPHDSNLDMTWPSVRFFGGERKPFTAVHTCFLGFQSAPRVSHCPRESAWTWLNNQTNRRVSNYTSSELNQKNVEISNFNQIDLKTYTKVPGSQRCVQRTAFMGSFFGPATRSACFEDSKTTECKEPRWSGLLLLWGCVGYTRTKCSSEVVRLVCERMRAQRCGCRSHCQHYPENLGMQAWVYPLWAAFTRSSGAWVFRA